MVAGQDRSRVFAPFQRLGDRSSEGVGLGLAVAQGFIEAMNGTIAPRTTPGGGLTMRICLPPPPTAKPAPAPLPGPLAATTAPP